MQKLFIKKEEKKEKKVEKKWTSVQDILNNRYLDARLKKRRDINKIAHVFLQMFPSFKREISFKEHSRIRLATIYIHHIPHTCTS